MSFSMEAKSKIWLVLVLSILCSGRTSAVEYDFLRMVHTWPPAALNGADQHTRSTPVLNRFTIQGLMPRRFSGDLLRCPSTPAFDLTKIADIRTELEEEWPNVEHPANSVSLWRYQWQAHGTCFSEDQNLYFQTGLDLGRSKDIYDALIEDGVVPGRQFYTRERIKAALGKKFDNFDPVLRCDVLPNRQRQLVDVVLCYTKTIPHTLIDCTFQADNCYGEFIWSGSPPPPPPPPSPNSPPPPPPPRPPPPPPRRPPPPPPRRPPPPPPRRPPPPPPRRPPPPPPRRPPPPPPRRPPPPPPRRPPPPPPRRPPPPPPRRPPPPPPRRPPPPPPRRPPPPPPRRPPPPRPPSRPPTRPPGRPRSPPSF